MSQEDESTFFHVNSSSFGLSARSAAAKDKTARLGKRRVFLVFLCFLIILIIFYVYKQAVPPKTPKSRKTKRHLKVQAFDQNTKIPVQDVEIVPENVNPKPIRKHPNHRYTETGPEALGGDGGLTVEDRKDWSSGPFEEVSGAVQAEWVRGLDAPKRGLVPSMRIKGIYSQPANDKGNAADDKLNYSKEINNLMQRGLGAKGGERNQREVLKYSGAPFQLPVRQKHRWGPKPSSTNQSPRGRPITIYLDFYPMKEMEGKRRLTQGKGFPPLGEGLLLRLNLYPKGGELESLRGGALKEQKGAASVGYRRNAERKSLGWFSKKEKKEDGWKECSLMGLNPHGKHITAKWKDEAGDWIHAERVAVKYLAKESH